MVSDSGSLRVEPDSEGLARSRIQFLLSEAAEPPKVRPTILASWRRSRDLNVAADKIALSYVRDPDTENQLSRSAEPVLRQLREQLDGQPVSIILTDPTGLVLSRRTGDADLDRHLDAVLLAPGFSYAEQFVGTNGIGTALESGAATAVFGHEHYAENLEQLACAGVPIHHPISGRTVGAVDLTCWRKDAESLLLTLAKATADQIQQALLGDSSMYELELFRAYRRTCHRLTGIVFAMTTDAVMLNDHARAMLAPADQDALFAHAAESAKRDAPERSGSFALTLPTGTAARMYSHQVHVGDEIAGVVVHVKLDDNESAGQSVVHSPASRMELPGLVGNAPMWVRACAAVEAGVRKGDWLAIEGEPGVGKVSLLRAAQVRGLSPGRFVVLDAADAQDDKGWSAAARRVITEEADSVVIRHVDRLDAVGLRSLSSALQQAKVAGRTRPLRAAVTLGQGTRPPGVNTLLRLFPTTVEVPPLRMRLEDLERLVPFFLGKFTDGAKISCSPEAMRILMRASWPGNVQQLHDQISHVVQHHRSGVIGPDDLPPDVRTVSRRLLSPLESMERDAIVRSLTDAKGDKGKAARALGMSRATMYRRIHDYGIVTSAGNPASATRPK